MISTSCLFGDGDFVYLADGKNRAILSMRKNEKSFIILPN